MSATRHKARVAAAGPTVPGFADRLREAGLALSRTHTEVLQVNLGKRCNQACHHCHVDAGPKRTEMMSGATAERIIGLLACSPSVHTVDLTGGAPELNPEFRPLVRAARALGKRVIDRCNLTVLFEPGQEDTAAFLAAECVEIVASLPCYSKDNVERQRGQGVFDQSIAALRQLNSLGYGRPGSPLVLDLVYNGCNPFSAPPHALSGHKNSSSFAARTG